MPKLSWMTFAKVGPQSFDINYSSSRGMRAVRRILVADRAAARTLVLGYNSKMPLVMENTTTLGTSGAVLEQLRTTGSAPSSIIYDAALNRVDGAFTLVNPNAKFQVQLGNQVVDVPAVTATGTFKGRSKSASGTFTFLNNKNNPILLEYSINFTGENVPRTERVVRAVPGVALMGEMEQALGPDLIERLSTQTGLDRGELLRRLTQTLPETVDRLTPEGQLPGTLRPQSLVELARNLVSALKVARARGWDAADVVFVVKTTRPLAHSTAPRATPMRLRCTSSRPMAAGVTP